MDNYYSFAFKGLLTEEALDKAGRKSLSHFNDEIEKEISERLSMDLLQEEFVKKSRKMAIVYTAICAFENGVRRFISDILLENIGEDWWRTAVSERIRSKAESRRTEEEKVRWHSTRGESPINFTEFGDLISIMLHNDNWNYFEPHIQNLDWAKQIIKSLERSRNVIMHGGDLGLEDISRIGINIRDWQRQVGE